MLRHGGSEGDIRTYSLGFFFGPGLPLGFNSPSLCAELLFTPVLPVFLTPSVGGGGIVDESSVPLGAGVLAFDSDPLSTGGDVTVGNMFDADVDEAFEEEAFDSGSLFTTTVCSKFERLLDDNLSITIMLLGAFFGRALPPDAGEALTAEPILVMCVAFDVDAINR